jgi:hypothetical protein
MAAKTVTEHPLRLISSCPPWCAGVTCREPIRGLVLHLSRSLMTTKDGIEIVIAQFEEGEAPMIYIDDLAMTPAAARRLAALASLAADAAENNQAIPDSHQSLR